MVNRFGISRGVSPRETFDQVSDIAKAVEANGFEALWFIDHQLGMKDVYTAMNVAAQATEKIHIGSGRSPTDSRRYGRASTSSASFSPERKPNSTARKSGSPRHGDRYRSTLPSRNRGCCGFPEKSATARS